MGFSLKNFLEEAVAQVNPFDGGKTASTVRQVRLSAPAQTKRKDYSQKPNQSFFNKVRDQFDANTEADNYRRWNSPQAQLERSQDAIFSQNLKKIRQDVVQGNIRPEQGRGAALAAAPSATFNSNDVPTNPIQQAGQAVLQSGQTVGNVGKAVVKPFWETGDMVRAAAQADQQNFRESLDQSIIGGVGRFGQMVGSTAMSPVSNYYADQERERAERLLTPAYENMYRAYGADPRLGANQAQVEAGQADYGLRTDPFQMTSVGVNDSLGTTARKVGAAGAEALIDTATAPAMALATTSALLKNPGKQFIKSTASSGLLGGAGNLAYTAQQDNVGAGDLAKAAGIGVATGVALPVTTRLVSKTARGAANRVKETNLKRNATLEYEIQILTDMNNSRMRAKGQARKDMDAMVLDQQEKVNKIKRNARGSIQLGKEDPNASSIPPKTNQPTPQDTPNSKLVQSKASSPSNTNPLESLKQEARKYKSAEEFVDTDKTISVPIKDFSKTDSTSWNEAINNVSKGELSKTNGPVEVVMTPNGYKLVEGNHRAVQALQAGKDSIEAKVISKEGLDKIAQRDGPHVKMNMQDTLTRQQLTDLYNQATQSQPPKSPPKTTTPVNPFQSDLEKAGLGATGSKAELPKENTPRTQKTRTQTKPDQSARELATGQTTGKGKQVAGQELPKKAASSDSGLSARRKQDQKVTKPDQGQQPQVLTDQQTSKRQVVSPSSQERGFVETIIDNPKTSPQVKEKLSSLYSVRNTKQLQTKAANLVKTDPDLAMRVAKEDTSDIGVATGSELIKKLQKDGNYEQAIDVATSVAETLTKAGQTAQAASIYGRLTPEGVLRFTQKEINAYNKATKKNIKLSPDQAKKLTDQAEKIQTMADGRAKDMATQQMLKDVYETMPPTTVEKVSTFQTMAQLLNPKTLIRNLGGNTIFSVLDNTSQVLATGIDKAISGVKGTPRTTTLPNFKTQAKGLKRGFNDGYEEAVKGINLGPKTQFDLNDVPVFRDGALGKAEKALNISLRATDRAAYTAAFDDTLEGLMKTNKVKTPTTEMIEIAHHQGLYRTFQDDSNASKIFVGLKKALNVAGFEQNGKRWGLGDLILKYPKTPGNLIARGIDYSPVGILRGMIDLAKVGDSSLKQQTAANSIARGVSGTAGLIGTGYALAGLGLITEKPEDNKDLRNLQKSAGLGGYQVNVSGLRRFILSGFDTNEAKLREGDKLVSYDWAQPAAIPLSMGASMGRGDGVKKGAAQSVNALSEGVETLAEQPLVRGVQNFFGSNKSAVDSVLDTVKGAPASFVPTLLNQVRQSTDNTTRNTSDPNFFKEMYNKAANRVPGVASSLPASVDTLGNNRENYQNGSNNPFNVFFNPSFVNKYQPNDVATLNLDLNRSTGETKQLPNTVSNKVKINGQDKQLTGKEQGEYQRYVGQTNSKATEMLSTNPRFNALSDNQKVNLLAALQTDINNAAKTSLFGDEADISESAQSIIDQNLERAIELKLRTQEKVAKAKTGKAKVAKVKKAKKGKKGRKGKKGGKGSKKTAKFDYTKNLFASVSSSNTKSLRRILEDAMKA